MAKRILVAFLLILVAFITLIFVWIHMGCDEKAELDKLFLPEPFIYVSLDITEENLPSINLILENFNFGFLKTTGLKFFERLILPCQVMLVAYLEEGQQKPDFSIFIKSRRLSRLNRLFLVILETIDFKNKKWQRIYYDHNYILVNSKKVNRRKINSYSVFKDMTCLSMRPAFLKNILEDYPAKKSIDWRQVVLRRCRWVETGGFVLVADNRNKELSRIINRAQEKSSFGFFPSIDSINCIGLQLQELNANILKGHFDFIYNPESDIEKIESDIDFLRLVLKRLFYSKKLAFGSVILKQEQKIALEFNISKMKDRIQKKEK